MMVIHDNNYNEMRPGDQWVCKQQGWLGVPIATVILMQQVWVGAVWLVERAWDMVRRTWNGILTLPLLAV